MEKKENGMIIILNLTISNIQNNHYFAIIPKPSYTNITMENYSSQRN